MIDEPLALLAEAFGQDPEPETRPTGGSVPATEASFSDMIPAVLVTAVTLGEGAAQSARHV